MLEREMKNGTRPLVGRYNKTKTSTHERWHRGHCASFEGFRHRIGTMNFRSRTEPYGFRVGPENDIWIEH